MFRSPRRIQVAKRARLDSATSGSGVTTSFVQARIRKRLAPPPVFRIRPPTPFNCPPGETGASGDPGEGSGYVGGDDDDDEVEAGRDSPGTWSAVSSDDVLDLLPRRR